MPWPGLGLLTSGLPGSIPRKVGTREVYVFMSVNCSPPLLTFWCYL